jgi:hypothetical protein
MNKRKMITGALLCGMFLLMTVAAPAQTLEDEIELTRATIQNQRQQIVAMGMELTEAEGAAFWPVYRAYRGELAVLTDRYLDVIKDYAENFEKLSDQHAERMLSDYFDIEKSKTKVRTKYIKRFKKVLPPKKVTRFYQLENKLDIIVLYEVIDQVPLVQ